MSRARPAANARAPTMSPISSPAYEPIRGSIVRWIARAKEAAVTGSPDGGENR